MNAQNKISYVEFPAKDLIATKTFFSDVFGWSFVDYGPEYTSFSNAGLEGGFYQSELTVSTGTGSALQVWPQADGSGPTLTINGGATTVTLGDFASLASMTGSTLSLGSDALDLGQASTFLVKTGGTANLQNDQVRLHQPADRAPAFACRRYQPARRWPCYRFTDIVTGAVMDARRGRCLAARQGHHPYRRRLFRRKIRQPAR